MPASMRSPMPIAPASRRPRSGRSSPTRPGTSARLAVDAPLAPGTSSRGPPPAHRCVLRRVAGLAAGNLQTEVPQALNQPQQFGLTRLDLCSLPFRHPAQRFIEGRQGRGWRLKIDLELAREILIAGAVVLGFG